MKSITKLKDEARKHEQKEEWEKAIRAYLQVLDAGDEDSGEIELPLFNRVGDLYVRLGRSKDAVKYYEQAADRYAEAGLYNNAIALCNKAQRYVSGNLELLRKLGQFSAQQGFITDARRYYLEYAERKIEAGELDAALKALASFADVSDDAEVRELLGRKLQAHGRRADAVHELRRACEMRQSAGEAEAAEALRAEILAIDPGAFLAEAAPVDSARDSLGAPPVEREPEAPEGEQHALETFGAAGLETFGAAGPEEGLETFGALGQLEGPESFGAFGPADTRPAQGRSEDVTSGSGLTGGAGGDEEYRIDLPDLDLGRVEDLPGGDGDLLEGLESGVFEGFADAGADLLPGLEPAGEFEAPADLPTLDLEGIDRPADAADLDAELPRLDTDTFSESEEARAENGAFDLPTLETDYAANEPSPSFDLPLLTDEPGVEAEPPESLSLLEPLPSLDDALDDALAESLEAPDGVEPLPVLPPLDSEVPAPASEREPAPPFSPDLEFPPVSTPEPVREPEREPGTEERERQPEAPRTPPEPEEPPPLLDPAASGRASESLDGFESETASSDSTGWDPSALGPAPPVPPSAPSSLPARKAPPVGDDFIDLGALLAEDDEKVTDTRFVVEESVPTGDEDQDFAELLSQFKQKVAEHVSAEDAAAHYDLGLAFKEMGLVDEAIGEFQIALRAGDMRLKVYEELGQCFLLKGQYNIAEKVLRRALESNYQDELELLGVYYHLARAYEALEKREEARDAYERVLGLDINFRDVSARLARL